MAQNTEDILRKLETLEAYTVLAIHWREDSPIAWIRDLTQVLPPIYELSADVEQRILYISRVKLV